VTIPKTLDRPINIQMTYFYRYGNIYRECQLNEIRKSVRALLQKCPYPEDDIDLNISKIYEMASAILWDGQYRCDMQGFKGDDEMYTIKLAFQINSDVKGSFG